jgi:hypothetical protein
VAAGPALSPERWRPIHDLRALDHRRGPGSKGGTFHAAAAKTAIENPVHVNDLHATMLYLFGIDHTRLIYRFQGRDFRLTDVAGHVVEAILA